MIPQREIQFLLLEWSGVDAKQVKQFIPSYRVENVFSNSASGNSRVPVEMLKQVEGKRRITDDCRFSNPCSL